MTRRSRQPAVKVLSPPTVDASDGETVGHQRDTSSLQSDDDTAQHQPLKDEDEEENDTDVASQRSTRNRSSLPIKRRGGRAPRGRGRPPALKDETEARDVGSDAGTPRKRGGWRGGGRWGKPRGGPLHVTQIPLDKEGNMANVKDDEIELPDDAEGETKVTKNGVLLGDREYKVRVFTIVGKGDRLYMLSTEPARCIGFRDSYLFFQKHKTLWKIILTEEAKRDLIERSLIPHSYKGRAIGVVTARSVFREFGAKIIIGGRRVVDDYQAAAARARGDVEGELAVPEDKIPVEGDAYDKNRFVAWHGASSVYHTAGASIPLPNGKVSEGKKRKVVVTGSNWMLEHAREASRFNSSIAMVRRRNLEGSYDAHTNVVQFPRIMQPTHARWELFGASESSNVEEAMNQAVRDESKFPPIPSIVQRNFVIADTYCVSPSTTGLGNPGPDGDILDVGPSGLGAISEDVAATLPSQCLRALTLVRREALRWKETWQGESDIGARAELRISYNQ